MKNLKKVLAMVLAFACTFTMFASAKMYEDVQPGSEFSEAITMLSDLGIIQGKTDNKYHPEDTITRAEACMLITRLMTGDPTAAGFGGAHTFKDVPAGHWASSAIGYCVVNGVAVGVDAAGTRFEPNRPIKDKEFVTMVVRALGYETPDMKLDFPFAYMSAARAIGLLNNVNMIPETDALRGEDAQVIYNAMFADYARGAKRINVAHGTSVESYPTLAESVWHLNRAALGTWNKKDNEDVTLSNCKAHTWVILGEAQDEENALLALAIDDNDDTKLYEAKDAKSQQKYKAYKFKYEGTADIDALRGYKVELWGAGKHGEPVWEKDGEKFVYSTDWKIKAIKTIAGQTKFDYNSSMADKKDDNGTIELNEETKLSLGSAADNAKLVKQEQGVKEVVTFAADELNTIKVKDGNTLEEALNVRNGMQYQLMDWNGDKEIDWVVVDEARYYKVESASSKRVLVTSMTADKNLKSEAATNVAETWRLDENEKIGKNLADKDVKIKYEVPEGLKEGDIVELTYKVTYDGAQLITATAKLVDAENHKLEKVGTKDGLTLTFDDKEMKVAQNAKAGDVIVPKNPEKYAGFNGEELGTEFALNLNRNGFIVYSDYATESTNYMMVLDTEGGKDQTGNRDLAVIDFVDAANVVHNDVKVDSDLRLLAKDGKTLKNTDGTAYDKRKFDEQQVVGNVFKYWTDADGVITKMQAVFTEDDAKDNGKKRDYEYKASADRLIDKDGSYVASLEDANVIFAVKKDYVKVDKQKGSGSVVLRGDDLEVDSNDVLATKQKDIPDINGSMGDTNPAELLTHEAQLRTTWLGQEGKDESIGTIITNTNNNKFIVNLDRNSEATAAILGVNNFNKFAAGATKLGLVTNVSYDSKDVVSADVAYEGEVKTISSAEKQDFGDIVKVYNGTEDKDVSSINGEIDVAGNNVFDNKTLADVVNHGGQYAEITTDADGKLTKLTFLDDADGNDNYMYGHYYHVSRNIMVRGTDSNLRYALNDGNNKGNTKADVRFANDGHLHSTGRLPADQKSYTSDAKFYEIDAKPTVHNKDYTGTRLTVNAGFDNLSLSDVKVSEKPMGLAEPNYESDDNLYEIGDLAFNNDNDLVAVYSFKDAMKEAYTNKLVGLKFVDDNNEVAFNGTITVVADAIHHTKKDNKNSSREDVRIRDFKIFDNSGLDVTSQFKVTPVRVGNFENVSATVQPITAMDGDYVIKAEVMVDDKLQVVEAGRAFTVTNNAKTITINQIQFATTKTDGYRPLRFFKKLDATSFVLYVQGETDNKQPVSITNVNKEDLTVKVGGQDATIVDMKNNGDGYYVVRLGKLADGTPVNFNTTQDNHSLEVQLNRANGNIQMPKGGLSALVTNTRDSSTITGGTVGSNSSSAQGTVTGVDNVSNITPVDPVITDKVTELTVRLETGEKNVLVTGLTADDFEVEVDDQPINVTNRAATTWSATVKEEPAKSGEYKFIFTDSNGNTDLRGHKVEIAVKKGTQVIATQTYQVAQPEATVTLTPDTLAATKGQDATGSTTVAAEHVGQKELRVWQEGTSYDQANLQAFDRTANIAAKVSGTTVTLSGKVSANAADTVKFIIGYGDKANEQKVLTVTVKDAAVAELKDTAATGRTAGVKEVNEVKAAATFAITKKQDNQNFKLKLGAEGALTADISTGTSNDTAAQNAKTQLEAIYGSKYEFSVSANNITIKAMTGKDGETIPTLMIENDTNASVGDAQSPATGVTKVDKVLGKVDFVINATANAGDALTTWEVKITGDQITEAKFDVTITDGMTPDEIAAAIKKAVTDASHENLEASVSGNTVTIKEKTDKAGAFFKNATFTATFAPKA